MSILGQFLNQFELPKRSIFVSYHHDLDQSYYNDLSNVFARLYKTIRDNSLDRSIDSNDPEYVIRRIREKYITGTSCTIVLCGAQTPWRKYVDWEIKATLDKSHGLIGILLPNNYPDKNGIVHVPPRLNDNIKSGYTIWIRWQDLVNERRFLNQCIEEANARPTLLIKNGRELRRRNGKELWSL